MTAPVSIPFPSICNGVYALFGAMEVPSVSKSQTITERDWIENDHAGEMLASEFMEPLSLGLIDLAAAIDVSPSRIEALIDGNVPVDGELDLRLTRYFGLSEGFFLRLQNQYELLEAKRALNGALDRIVPRAA